MRLECSGAFGCAGKHRSRCLAADIANLWRTGDIISQVVLLDNFNNVSLAGTLDEWLWSKHGWDQENKKKRWNWQTFFFFSAIYTKCKAVLLVAIQLCYHASDQLQVDVNAPCSKLLLWKMTNVVWMEQARTTLFFFVINQFYSTYFQGE